jgi:hypothetical protein
VRGEFTLIRFDLLLALEWAVQFAEPAARDLWICLYTNHFEVSTYLMANKQIPMQLVNLALVWRAQSGTGLSTADTARLKKKISSETRSLQALLYDFLPHAIDCSAPAVSIASPVLPVFLAIVFV